MRPCKRGRSVKWRRHRRSAVKPVGQPGAKVKKLCWHTTFGDIRVEEPQYRRATKRLRPFAQSAKVSNRGCSRPLQRVVTDFGADIAFAQVMDKLVEHYGVMLGESTI